MIMAKLSKFDTLLREFESATMPKKYIGQLRKYLENDNLYHPLFESYVSARLRDNVHPERLLNMAYNLEKDDNTRYLSKTVNRQVAESMLLKRESFDQFYFMCRHDTRSDNHILTSFLDYFSDHFGYSNDSFEMLEKIGPHIGSDKISLILKMMGDEDFGKIRNMRLMNKLSVNEKYDLMVRALETHNSSFCTMIETTFISGSGKGDIHDHLKEAISKNGDNDPFAVALRNTLIPITELESSFKLNRFLELYSDYIPETLDSLYYRADQENRWEYLLLLGAHKNKKEVLRSIVRSKDQELIDKFFYLYKNSPEVKHLVPFL